MQWSHLLIRHQSRNSCSLQQAWGSQIPSDAPNTPIILDSHSHPRPLFSSRRTSLPRMQQSGAR